MLMLFLIGVFSSFVGSLVGGGGLISIPLLNLVGLPLNVAIATDRLSSIGQASSIYKYHKSNKIIYKNIVLLSVISLIGAIIGSKILLSLDKDILVKTLGVIFIVFLAVLLTKKDIGYKLVKTSKFKKVIGFFLYFLVAIYAGFFGAGTGILATLVFIFLFGYSYINSNATYSILWLIIAVFSSILFAFEGIINYQYALVVFVGSVIGGHLGASTAIKKGEKFVRVLFFLLIIVFTIKFLFFSN